MPRRKSPPRLYFDQKNDSWVIRDGSDFIRTGCRENEREQAEKRLAEYIGEKHQPQEPHAPLVAEMLTAYANNVACNFPKRRRTHVASSIKFLLDWWSAKRGADITASTCRKYWSTRTPEGGVADLKVLKAATVYWHKEVARLPFVPDFWRPPPREPKDRWLTREEAARLVREAKPYQHLRRAILLGLYTGSRPGVILGLRWEQIDLVGKTLSRKLPGAALSNKKRAPKVRLGNRIIGHLRRWKRIDGHLCPFVCHFDGNPVVDPHTSWRKVLKAAALTDITRHTWRHTRATWLMLEGVDLWEAAGHLGMSIKTLERVYGHHHPRFQERAANV